MTKEIPLEDKVLKLSVETKQPATTLAIEYINYIRAGLQPCAAYQYLEMRYKGQIDVTNNRPPYDGVGIKK